MQLVAARLAARVAGSCFILGATLFPPPLPISVPPLVNTVHPALAADTLNPEQRLVAQAWKTADKFYVDRTFNNHADWFQIRQDFVHRKYRTADETYAAVGELLKKLDDPYTRFLEPSKYDSMVNSVVGEVAGAGVELLQEGGRVVIGDVQPNSPAEAIGVKSGDVLLAVDSIDVTNTSPDEVAKILRGPAGTKVGFSVRRADQDLDLRITRQVVQIKGVTSTRFKSGTKQIGGIRIKSFAATTSDEVKAALTALQKEGPLDTIVLDLRGNAGGLLPGSVDVAQQFLPKGQTIVTTTNYKGFSDKSVALSDGQDLTTPMVLLVNGKTASAAEVLTAALQENGRAVVVGEQSFGKGIVQSVQELQGGSGMAVTIARYATPNDNYLNKVGIKPDVPLTCGGAQSDIKLCVEKAAAENNALLKGSL